MPCYHPLKGYRAVSPNPSGKYSISFTLQEGYRDLPIEVPCSQCIGCRLERSRQWAIRCVHEASLYEDNCFLTLTYSNDHLPAFNSLQKSDFQKFMKRLRFENQGRNIRYFHCGEYGEQFQRPHYHACLFNFDFPDKEHFKTHNGQKYYRSKQLERLWPHGHSMIGAVTFESAAYVARYITKKITGKNAEEHYEVVDLETGEVRHRTPEYVTMSRRPGIGKTWYDKFKKDIYPHDFVVVRKDKMIKAKPPKFYNQLFEIEYPDDYAKLKAERKNKAQEHADNNTFPRLKVRKEVQTLKAKQLKRSYESGT